MKFENMNAFGKHVKDAAPGHLSAVYFVLVEDEFERREAVDGLIRGAVGKEERALCVKRFEGSKLDVGALFDELMNVGLFVKQQVVIVENCDKLVKEAQKRLVDYFEGPSEGVTLILTGPKLNKSTNLYKKGEKVGVVLEMGEEKAWQKEKTIGLKIQARVTANGKTITPRAVQLLQQHMGTDSALVHQELEKLFCYVGERTEITEKDVAAICTKLPIETAWQLGDALFDLNLSGALRITKGLFAEGVNIIELLRQLRSQFKTKLHICSIMRSGGSPQSVSAQFPYMRGQILQRNIEQANRFGWDRAQNGLVELDRTELQAKNSSLAPDFLAEMLMVKLIRGA